MCVCEINKRINASQLHEITQNKCILGIIYTFMKYKLIERGKQYSHVSQIHVNSLDQYNVYKIN